MLLKEKSLIELRGLALQTRNGLVNALWHLG